MGIDWWFSVLPWVVGCVWVLHLVLTCRRPARISAAGWFLFVGLPVAGVAIFVTETRLYPPGEQQPDEALLGPGFGLVALAFEVVACWFAVLIVECLLVPIRRKYREDATRRARQVVA